jgi:chorismate dehydratase
MTPQERPGRPVAEDMKLKIAKVPYLSNALFYHGLENDPKTRPNLEFVNMVPSVLSKAVLGEQVDAGPVSLITTFELADRYEQLGDLCVATLSKSRSVLLFSKHPVEELEGATIGLSHECVTSARLLDVLFAQLYGINVDRYVAEDEPNDGFLLIGDQALLNRGGIGGYPFVTDLCEVWHDRTGLPFVHTVWMVRKSLPREQKEFLRNIVTASVNEGWKHLKAATRDKIRELGMTRAEVREYLDEFRFRMGPAEHDAIRKFSELELMTRNLEAEETAGPGGVTTK